MADEQTNQPSRPDTRAFEYRMRSQIEGNPREGDSIEEKVAQIEMGLQSTVSALWAIAAELAEANSRDREAEIRAKGAEAFVAGIQQQLAAQHIVVPGGVQIKPPRGK